MKISAAQEDILRALLLGATLKSHRSMDGAKTYQLHALTGDTQIVRQADVQSLRDGGLLHSNQKFPAATYILTEQGRRVAASLSRNDGNPLTAGNR